MPYKAPHVVFTWHVSQCQMSSHLLLEAFICPNSNGRRVPDLVLCCLLLKHSLLQGSLHKNVGTNSLVS